MFCQNIGLMLDLIGMDKKLKGYRYSLIAINELAKGDLWQDISAVYCFVGLSCNTKKENVERNIRYAIENTWEQGNIKEIDKIFGYTVDKEKGKPTNREFIFMIADRVMINNS